MPAARSSRMLRCDWRVQGQVVNPPPLHHTPQQLACSLASVIPCGKVHLNLCCVVLFKSSMKEELIAIVHLTPVLWDKTHRQHHNRHVLEKEWKKIATQFGTTDKQVRHVWKNLRQEFGKQLRKTLKSGSAAPDEPSSHWPYFESMLFLTDQFIPRPSSGNLATNYDDSSVIVSEDGEEEGNGDDIQIEQLETIVLAPNHPTNEVSGNLTNVAESRNVSKTKTGYTKRVTPQTVIGQQLLELEKEKLKMKQNKAAENPNDEDIGFFNSLLPHVRKLSPRDKLRFRMQVQEILFDMAYPHQQPMTASSTPYMALSPQHSATSSSTSFYPLYESGHEDATTGNTAADGGSIISYN
ncbi:hypothetical protein J6590_018952 [Homalodisca vitripennis]|nr:hypothetical protein J6590_018952 [Homalodisca vitripennis]